MFVSLVIPEATGFQSCSDDFWAALVGAIRRHSVTFVGGDFNMSLLTVVFELRKHNVGATFLGSHVWLEHNTRGRGASDRLTDCRFDSLGLFAVTAVTAISRALVSADLRTGNNLQEHVKGQGYPATSYLGGMKAVDAAFLSTHGRGVSDALPHIKQKAICAEAWDAPNALFASGAHMPLLFYIGDRSYRTEKKLEEREAKMAARGWGPGSTNRYRLMERQAVKGKGKNDGKGKGDGKDKGAVTSAVAAAKAPAAARSPWAPKVVPPRYP